MRMDGTLSEWLCTTEWILLMKDSMLFNISSFHRRRGPDAFYFMVLIEKKRKEKRKKKKERKKKEKRKKKKEKSACGRMRRVSWQSIF